MFGYDFELQFGFNFVIFSGEMDDLVQFDVVIIDVLENWWMVVVGQEVVFVLVKKEMIGWVVFMVNFLEVIVNWYD